MRVYALTGRNRNVTVIVGLLGMGPIVISLIVRFDYCTLGGIR